MKYGGLPYTFSNGDQSPSEPGMRSLPFLAEPVASLAESEEMVRQTSEIFEYHDLSNWEAEYVDNTFTGICDCCSFSVGLVC